MSPSDRIQMRATADRLIHSMDRLSSVIERLLESREALVDLAPAIGESDAAALIATTESTD